MVDAHWQPLEAQIDRLMSVYNKVKSEKAHLESVIRMLEREITERSDEVNRLEHELIMHRRAREEVNRYQTERGEMRDKIGHLLRDLESIGQE